MGGAGVTPCNVVGSKSGVYSTLAIASGPALQPERETDYSYMYTNQASCDKASPASKNVCTPPYSRQRGFQRQRERGKMQKNTKTWTINVLLCWRDASLVLQEVRLYNTHGPIASSIVVQLYSMQYSVRLDLRRNMCSNNGEWCGWVELTCGLSSQTFPTHSSPCFAFDASHLRTRRIQVLSR